jgi:septal ring factor EnvC (AmiA/AmiB activator)
MDRAIIAVQTLAIQELSKQLSSIQEQLAEKSSKLDALQAANAATSSQMAALLAWAQTQGFSGTF